MLTMCLPWVVEVLISTLGLVYGCNFGTHIANNLARLVDDGDGLGELHLEVLECCVPVADK